MVSAAIFALGADGGGGVPDREVATGGDVAGLDDDARARKGGRPRVSLDLTHRVVG